MRGPSHDPQQAGGLHQIAIDAPVAAGVQHIAYTSYVDAERTGARQLLDANRKTPLAALGR